MCRIYPVTDIFIPGYHMFAASKRADFAKKPAAPSNLEVFKKK